MKQYQTRISKRLFLYRELIHCLAEISGNKNILKTNTNQKCMRSAVSSGTVVFIGGGRLCKQMLQIRDVLFLTKRRAAVET